METNNILNRIIFIPALFQIENKSVYDLLKETGYYQLPNEIDEEKIKKMLQQYPIVIDIWLQWSDDKRTSSGWYFTNRNVEKYIVGFLANGNRGDEKIFSDRETACAYYIKQEIENIRTLSYVYDANKRRI